MYLWQCLLLIYANWAIIGKFLYTFFVYLPFISLLNFLLFCHHLGNMVLVNYLTNNVIKANEFK